MPKTRRAYAAMHVYLETLQAELAKEGTDIMSALKHTSHEHLAVVMGDVGGLVRFIIAIDTSAAGVAAALRTHAANVAGAKVTTTE